MSNLLNDTKFTSQKDLDYLVGIMSLMLINFDSLDDERKMMTVNMALRIGLGRTTTNIVVPRHDDLIKKAVTDSVKRVMPTIQRRGSK